MSNLSATDIEARIKAIEAKVYNNSMSASNPTPDQFEYPDNVPEMGEDAEFDEITVNSAYVAGLLGLPVYEDDTNAPNGTFYFDGVDATKYKDSDGTVHTPGADDPGNVLGGDAQDADAVAVGPNAQAIDPYSMAAATGATATGSRAMAFGWDAEANGTGPVAIGERTQATNTTAASYGSEASATGSSATAVGSNAQASAGSAFAGGVLATAGSGNSVALGRGAEAMNSGTVALGWNSSVTGMYSVGLTPEVGTVSADSAVGVGNGATVAQDADSTGAVAIGNEATAGGDTIDAPRSIAIGSVDTGDQGAQTAAADAVAIGTETVVNTEGAGRIGVDQLVHGGSAGTVADADLNNGEITVEADEANNQMVIRYKTSGGTVREGLVDWEPLTTE